MTPMALLNGPVVRGEGGCSVRRAFNCKVAMGALLLIGHSFLFCQRVAGFQKPSRTQPIRTMTQASGPPTKASDCLGKPTAKRISLGIHTTISDQKKEPPRRGGSKNNSLPAKLFFARAKRRSHPIPTPITALRQVQAPA